MPIYNLCIKNKLFMYIMKIAIRTFVFHILCIFIFAFLYYFFRADFKTEVKENYTVLDYIFLSVTIQSGVGLTDIYPIDFYGKLTMIIQQLVLIMTHVFTIYIFTV
jgi:hypothetical protein